MIFIWTILNLELVLAHKTFWTKCSFSVFSLHVILQYTPEDLQTFSTHNILWHSCIVWAMASFVMHLVYTSFMLCPQFLYWKRQCASSPYVLSVSVLFYSPLLSLSLFLRDNSLLKMSSQPVVFHTGRVQCHWTLLPMCSGPFPVLLDLTLENLNSSIMMFLFHSLCLS